MGDPHSVVLPKERMFDIDVVHHKVDLDWAIVFDDKTKDPIWCKGLSKFEAAALCGRPMCGIGEVPHRASWEVHRERKLRHRYGVFAGAEMCKDRAYREEDTPSAPALPRDWNERLEVPYSMRVGTPLPLRPWCTSCTQLKYYDGLREDDPLAYARWYAAYTLYAQDVAAALLDSASHHERLFFIPPTLAAGMRRIGFATLTGSAKAVAFWSPLLGR